MIVADDHDSPEAEAPATLNDLGGTSDMNDALVELLAFVLVLRPPPFSSFLAWHPVLLELQSAFAGPVGQRLDPTVIRVTAAIEHDLLQTLGQSPLGHQLAHARGLLCLVQARQVLAHFRIQGRGRSQGVPHVVINHLGIDVLQAAKNVQARALGGAMDSSPNTLVAARASYLTRDFRH
jgi:hypothetical protein